MPIRGAGDLSWPIAPFPLGTHDISDQLRIPQKLYGRAYEIETLLASFDRVVASGTPELVLVSGYSGIGKSSLGGCRLLACRRDNVSADAVGRIGIFPLDPARVAP